MLSDFFASTVAAGWRPSDPCTDEHELSRLEQSTIRGDCIAPLLQEGDTVYIDREAVPQPGDIVSFAMSQRLAESQNASPPPGQLPNWKRGDRWAKLYGRHHGLHMLFDRHGGSVTATLATLEDPDGDPLPHLHPVRQVRRDGRLLFAPETQCSQIGLNASSQIVSNAVSGTQTITFAATGGYFSPVFASITTHGYAVGIDVTADFATSGFTSDVSACYVFVQRSSDGQVGTGKFDIYNAVQVAGHDTAGQVTLTLTDTPAAATWTYYMQVYGVDSTDSKVLSLTNPCIKLREYKR